MKKSKTGHFSGLYAIPVFALSAIVLFAACSNPIIEKWWEQGNTDPGLSSGKYHVVNFNADGGSPFVEAQLIADKGKVAKVGAIAKAHHGFAGWFTNTNSSGGLWDFENNTVTKDLILYAGWVPAAYTVTFDSKGGNPVPDPQTLLYGSTVEEPAPMTNASYGFGGWYTDELFTLPRSGGWDFNTDTVDGDITLFAKWEPIINSRTVKFVNFQEDIFEWVSVRPDQRIADGGKVIEPALVSKPHYVFAGWYTDEKFTDKWDFSVRLVNRDETLHIKWEGEIYTVKFVTNGGLPQPIEQQVVYNGKVTVTPPISRPGFGFGGWFTDAAFSLPRTGGWDFATDTVEDNMTLYANWVTTYIQVTFNANSGTPAPEPQRIVVGGKATQPPAMNRPSYAFGGWWFDDPVLGLVEWDFATAVNTNITLHAKWVPIPVSVTFITNAPLTTEIPRAQALLAGTPAQEPNPIIYAGHIFGGWFTDDTRFFNEWDFNRPVERDMSLYAKWDELQKQFVVNFVANGGTPEPGSQRIISGGLVVEPLPMTGPTGTGFAGWFTKDGTGGVWGDLWEFSVNAVTAANTIDDILTLYAKWDTNRYNVNFVPDSGTPTPVPNPQVVAHGGLVVPPLAMSHPDKKGFGGWYEDPGFSGDPWNFAEDDVTGVLTLYAKWDTPSYTVTFTADDKVPPLASPAPLPQIVARGGYAVRPQAMTRVGYSFGGWFRNPGFTVRWSFATSPVNEDITLYAKWEPNHYTVKFNATNDPIDPPNQVVAHGGTVVRPAAISIPSYGFSGWYTEVETIGTEVIGSSANEWNFTTGKVYDDMTLYAGWELVRHKIFFEANGGSPVPAGQQVADNSLLTRPPSMTKPGYYFGGWFTKADFSDNEPWNFASSRVKSNDVPPVPLNVTLYALWEPDQYTVTFMANGGLPAPESQCVLYGSKVTSPAPMARSGYTFRGWFENASFTGDPWNFAVRTVSGNLTLYAQWERNYLTVTFAPDGGNPPPDKQQVLYDSTVNRPPVIAKTGFIFGGWFADINFVGYPWNFTADRVLEDMTLYAKWDKMTPIYTVTFAPDGGLPAPNPQLISEGAKAVEPAPMSKPNAGFDGWYINPGFTGGEWSFSREPVVQNITLYAKWVDKYCEVRFYPNEGEPIPVDQFVAYGAKVKEPLAMSRPDHNFDGWFLDPLFTKRWDFNVGTVTADLTRLYAKWIPNEIPPVEIVSQIRVIGVYYIDFAGNSITYNGPPVPPQGTTALTPQQVTGNDFAVQQVAAIMKQNPKFLLQLSGHANPVNPNDANEMNELREISEKRAEAMVDIFKGTGISSDLMINIGFNERLYGDNAHGSMNRVVELIILEIIIK